MNRITTMTAFRLTLCAVLIPAALEAQRTTSDIGRPRFLLESANVRVPVDLRRSPALQKPVQFSFTSGRLSDALSEVSKQTGLAIAYSGEVVDSNTRVSPAPGSTTVAAALLNLLSDKGVDVILLADGSAAIVPSGSETRQRVGAITGHVRHALTNAPIAGATVSIPGTQFNALTADDGAYRLLQVPAGTVTVIARRLGFRPSTRSVTVTDNATATVDFTMQVDALLMNEVVVTGVSGQTERRQLGNSITSLATEELRNTASIAIDKMLTGKAPGVMVQQNSGNPGGGISVRLRGTSTLLGTADPLYVVDGVIVNNNSSQLIYLGGYTQNRLVDLNPEDVERIEIVKGAAAAALYGSRANNGVVQIFTKRGAAGVSRLDWYTGYSTSSLRKRLQINRHPTDNAGNPVTRYDNQDVIFRNAGSLDVGGSMSGSSGDTRYFFSGGNSANEGIVRNSDFARSNGRLRLDHTLNPWAAISVGAAAIVSRSHDVPNGGLGALLGAIDGFLFGPNTYDPRRAADGSYSGVAAFANPSEVVERYQFSSRTTRFIGDVHLTLTPLAGLKVEYILGNDAYSQLGLAFVPRGVATPGNYALGYAENSSADQTQLNNDLSVTYQRQVKAWLHSTSAVGATAQSELRLSRGASSFDLSPVAQIVPGGANRTISESRSKRIVQGAYGQQTLGFHDRVFVTGALRVDASSVFDPDNRVQVFPKFSGSYLLSDEGFWANSPLARAFPQFKLRAAWGQSGGLTAIGPFDRFTNYTPTSYEGKPALNPGGQRATAIKPERQTATEIGVDATVISDRIALEVNWYQQHTTDLLLTRSVALTTGYSTQLQNVGTIDNDGLEVMLRTTPVATPQVTWNSTLSYSANRNVVSDIAGGVRTLGGFGFAAAINGQPLGVYYARGFERNAAGQILDINGNVYTDIRTQIPRTSGAASIIGNPTPDWIGSFSNEVSIGRNLRLRAQIDGVVGGDVWNYDNRIGANTVYCTLWLCEDELAGRVAAGRGTAMYTNFEYWIEDGSYFKLREVSASYSLRPRVLKMRELSLSLIGRNLMSFDNYSGYDPETNTGGQSTAVRGYQFAEVPIPRSVAVMVRTAF